VNVQESGRADLRCSTYARDQGVDPIGTAGSYRGYLLIEWPLPWPSDFASIPGLARATASAAALGLRVQGLVASRSSRRSLICYFSPPGPFQRYHRREVTVGAGEVEQAAVELVELVTRGPTQPVAEEVRLVDVLVCTHGSRDRCCGSLGTELANSVSESPSLLSGSGETVRLWRTSHTGGHRFAPNVIVLPSGTVWGYAQRDSVEAILSRREPAGLWLDGYRGCSGLPGRELQILERAALQQIGWSVLDFRRSGTVVPSPEGGLGHAILELESPDGVRQVFEGEVGIGRRLLRPECGQPVDRADAVEEELVLSAFRQAELPSG
jgi:hypothetical protein